MTHDLCTIHLWPPSMCSSEVTSRLMWTALIWWKSALNMLNFVPRLLSMWKSALDIRSWPFELWPHTVINLPVQYLHGWKFRSTWLDFSTRLLWPISVSKSRMRFAVGSFCVFALWVFMFWFGIAGVSISGCGWWSFSRPPFADTVDRSSRPATMASTSLPLSEDEE